MKHCDSCNGSYSDEFRFCPIDATILRSAAACENPPCSSVTAHASRSRFGVRKWGYVVVAIVIAGGALLVFTRTRGVQLRDQADSQPPVVHEARTNPAAKRASVDRRRTTHAADPAPSDESRDSTNDNDLVQQARVQQLVATGYRRMQQRDYESAREAFEDALEIDPHNSAAQKGLSAARTAESVEGMAGVFRR